MGVYKKEIITDAGNAMLSRAAAGEAMIRFSKAVTSSWDYPDGTDWKQAVELKGIMQETTPTDIRVETASRVDMRVMFGNENILTPYMIENIGIYASDGTEEVLFSVSEAVVPDQMPEYNGVAPSSFIYNIGILVSQASAVQTTVNPAGTATVQDVLDLRAAMERLYRDVVVLLPLGWTEADPYTQEVAVPGLKVGDPAELWSAVSETTSTADAKVWNKMASMISYAQIREDGKLTVICKAKKPTSEFKVRLKGVSRI